ncbi:dynein axonemal assembly factor 8 isoform X2 [Channa argus]|uniref:dynein axonemal assembly factor 8 isoform X2 n=1 Tax=Channa argus TaxID=215402 RepID=UPI0035205876
MDLNASSTWNSILEQVKPHIPTIGLDSSTSENEEIVTVYQRPAGLSLQTLEDHDSFSIDSADLEELLKPIAQTCLPEETCSLSVNLDDDETLESPKQHYDDNVKRLEQWDLDDVLQNLKKDELSLQCVSANTVKPHANDDKNKYIMERLAAFCKSQSSVSKPVKSPDPIRKSNLQSVLLEKMAADLKQNHQDCPTVFIDLRCPDPPIKPKRIPPNLSSKSVSPAKHSTQQGVPSEKKPNPKVHTALQIDNRELTVKSMLLQKIRQIKINGNKLLNKYTNPPDSVVGEGILGNEMKQSEEKPLQPTEPSSGHNTKNLREDEQSSGLQSETRKPKMENLQTIQQSSVREPKQQRDQQRKKLKQTLQHKKHQKIVKQLEMHRPTKSVHQKQPAAERTDVLCDLEASHLQSISMLPENIKRNGCLLLIVNLSSPGMVGDRAHGKRKHLYSAATKSHIYNTLVAWFLSLVKPDPHQDKEKHVANVPFWIAGLQQLWTEDGLALHVLAVARHCYTLRKRDKDIHAPFYNHACRFLSETTLTQIAHWLPELQILLDERGFSPLIHLPSLTLNYFVSATSNKKVMERTFCLSPGFYWQTVETQEWVCNMRETSQELHTEVSYALGCNGLFLHPLITHYTLQLVSHAGLDVCGLRLLYPQQRFLTDCAGGAADTWKDDETCQPVFVLAVRGPHAFSTLQHLTSSLYPLLHKRTDTTSVSPLQCKNQRTPLFYSSQLASQVHMELCLWFAGRLTGESIQNHSEPPNRVLLSDGERGSLFNLSSSSAFLCATTKADVLLVVSPAVPSCCYGQVLAICDRRGFSLKGLQMLQLQSKGAVLLRLTTQQVTVFCCSPTVTLSKRELELPSQCLVLLLRKENAIHHSVGLPAALVRELKTQKLLGCINSRHDGIQTVEAHFCFHTVPYSSKLYNMFVKCMWTVPDPSAVILSRQKCISDYDMEQVVILTLCGKDMGHGLSLLHQMLTEGPEGDGARFKLLGLKWLPVLTQLQAQELSPYEVGEQHFHNSLDNLMSFPALVCALRGKDTFGSLRKLIEHNYPSNLSVLMSPTPQVAFRQASLFFDHGTIHDLQMLLTVCLFKPGVWNHALHIIFQKLQESGLTVVGMRVVALDKHEAASLLPTDSDPSELEAHIEYLCSGSSVAFCLQGENAVKRLLYLLGQEDLSLWTHCYDRAHLFNGIYGSGSYEKATGDVKRFFPDGLCCTESSIMRQEQIFSICSDPLASVEREQICTLVSLAQKSLQPLMASGPNRGFLIHSALWQTTCLLIPLSDQLLSQVPSQLEMLLRSGCHLVAGRMTVLDHEQRQHIAEILKVSSSGNDKLYMASCLIMALQGEKIVTNINLILQGIDKERADLKKMRESIIYPQCEKEAKQLICYLFDSFTPENSCDIIMPKNSNV